MSTTIIPTGATTQSANSANSSSSSNSSSTNSLNLSPSDFVQFLITEMQDQDPMNPTSSDTMLQEMSEIGQLQSSNSLQSTLASLTLQTQIGSAGNLIGKSVTGTDDNQNPVSGTVNSVKVQNNTVYLQLDSGGSLQLGNVSNISQPATTTGTTTTGTTTSGTTTTTGA